jgi:hypothetical protein
LQTALAAADSGEEIWVATGVYTPGTGVDDTFTLRWSVALYGGFAATETQRTQRDWVANPTVLSGDIDGDDTTDPNGVVTTTNDIVGDNSYHVVTGSGVNASAVLDGFTITAGKSPYLSYQNGGGMYVDNGSPTLVNISLSGNSAFGGGGMYIQNNSNPSLTNVTFYGNSTGLGAGGGLYNDDSSPTLTNVAFSGNSASSGAGMYNSSSNPLLINVTFSGNLANIGAGITNYSSTPRVRNTILWNNKGGLHMGTITSTIYNSDSTIILAHSLVEGSGGSSAWISDPSYVDGLGNLDLDPRFIEDLDPDAAPTTGGNLRLDYGSPAINAGNNSDVSGVSTDLDGNPRLSGESVDMGAYEFQCPSGDTQYVDHQFSPEGDGSSWTLAKNSLGESLYTASHCSAISQIFVASGVYTPGTTVSDTFQLVNGVAVYGGFDPGSDIDLLSERDWIAYPTVLSGDIGGDDITDARGVVTTTENIVGDNSYHVLTGSGVTETAVLDGFSITAGQADGECWDYPCEGKCGGGMYNLNGNPSLTNVNFSGNFSEWEGGAVYNGSENGASSPRLNNVIFSGNSAGSYGGGMYNIGIDGDSSPSLINVTFSGNIAEFGGGMYNYESSPSIVNATFNDNYASWNGAGIENYMGSNPSLINVIFSGNTAANNGGGIANEYGSNPVLTNVTISGNSTAVHGGGMYNYYSSPHIRNSILWNNQDSTGLGTLTATIQITLSNVNMAYSLIQGTGGSGSGWIGGDFVDGGNNLDSDPQFIQDVDPATAPTTSGNLRLGAGSPAINMGNSDYVSDVTTDLDGNARISGSSVDMGAYEVQYYTLTVSLAGSGSGTVSGGGINCTDDAGGDCTQTYPDGTVVNLTASADSGSTFNGWSGACSGTGDCEVNMTEEKSITATFVGLDVYIPLVFR